MMRFKCLAAAVCALMLLSGCSGGSIYSNYRELEQLMVIQTMGFDLSPEGYLLSVSSGSGTGGAEPSGSASGGSESSGTSEVARLSASASSLSSAQKKIQDYSASEQLFYAHTSYIAIGGKTASKSLAPFLDYIERSTILRLDTPLFVVTGGTAAELVLGAGGESYDATSVLKSLERNLKLRGDSVIFNAAQVISALDTNGCALICAIKCVKADESVKDAKPSELTALPDGYTVIKNGRTVGHIPFDSARAVNILTNKTGPSTIDVSVGGKRAVLQLDNCSCDIEPHFASGKLAGLDVKVTLSSALAESDGITEPEALSGALSKELEREIRIVLDTAKSQSCDFLQLGSVLERKEPKKLSGAGAGLSDMLSDINYNVNVSATVTRSFDLEVQDEIRH